MPIDMAPPSPNLQGFQIAPVQYTDPLQTLSQMGQLRTQNLQQQSAQMGLEQERMKLDSSKDLMNAMVNGGGDFEKTFKLATQPGSKVMPADLIALRQHYTQMQQEAANLDKTTRENTAAGIDQYRGLLANVQTPDDLAAANARADQLGIPKTVPRHAQFSDPSHVQAFSNGLAAQSQLLKEATERATKAKEEAQTGLAGVQTTEANQKVQLGEEAQVARELQNAEMDPATGTPTPAAMAQIQARHPKVQLPLATQAGIDKFVRSTVPAEKQPEFDLNKMKSDLGLMGNTEFDQYQLKYAQSLGKKPNQLNFPEFSAMTQRYAKDKQDPSLLALILTQKGLQNQVAQAQVASIPNAQDIDSMARQMVHGDMSPDDLKLFRSRFGNAATQAIRRAEEIVNTEGNPMFPGKPFSIANLQTALETRELTEKKFADGPQADMVRSFDNLMQHTALLDDARKAMTANDLPALKAIANIFGVASGGTAQTTYDTIADFVASESGKAFQPAGGGEADRAKTYSHFERNLGNDQISKNITALMHLADSQRAGLERQYARGTFGKGLQTGKLFAPESLAARDRLMGKAQGQQLQYVRMSTGANNHKIGQTADGKWHDVETGAVIQ